MLKDLSDHRSIDYLDFKPSASLDSEELIPDAVAENQGRPLLYIINSSNLSPETDDQRLQLRLLRRRLGSRGERAYLGILEPGQLTVFPISLSSILPKPQIYREGEPQALAFFSKLSLGEYQGEGEPSTPDYVYSEMLGLLEHVADELADGHGLSGSEVLSLVGRALFFRFLCDRAITKPASLRSIAPGADSLAHCFETIENASATCSWLDATFNGDFLRLIGDDILTTDKQGRSSEYLTYFSNFSQKTSRAICHHLSAILHGHVPAGADYQVIFDEKWAKFDFAHVPVGLLSQVYEAFSWRWRWSEDAKGTSVHYTPRHIADYLIQEAFHELPDAAEARVLDPACGAGVFLVLAFRKLYEAKWRALGGQPENRPDTVAIREILEKQIVGFDVNENALRLASLSLYLTAIELDPEPSPPSKLRFKNLRNRVLYNCRQPSDPTEGPIIGSLGRHVGAEHDGAYDVVLCNPPWTRLEGKYKAVSAEMNRISREIISRCEGAEALAKTYQNPDNVPDLPFVWRSTEWCRPGGRIGLVLPGRNLFKQEAIPSRARETLFKAITVNGILNCSNLSDTKVWPEMNQPFLLMFACNQKPRPNQTTRWVTPYCDVDLNNRNGEIRIDSESVHLINIESTFDEPWLWKAMALGTSLDVEVVRKIKAADSRPVLKYWEDDLGLTTSNGYSIKNDPTPKDASFLFDLPQLSSTKKFRFVVDTSVLSKFKERWVSRPRKREAYRSPLLILKQAPGESRKKGFGLLALEDVVYNESFHGYSAYGHSFGTDLARYLHLFAHCEIWMHYSLCSSPKFGAERRKFYKSDFDDCPFIPFERLNLENRKLINTLSDRLISEDFSVLEEIDAFFAELYGLSKADREVISDTLEMALPFSKNRIAACMPAPQKTRKAYTTRLRKILRPFVKKHNSGELTVEQWTDDTYNSEFPYQVLLIGKNGQAPQIDTNLYRDQILALANANGASRVIVEAEDGLVVGILNHQRYWTQSRARLLAAEIINRHMEIFQV